MKYELWDWVDKLWEIWSIFNQFSLSINKQTCGWILKGGRRDGGKMVKDEMMSNLLHHLLE